ncbi:hypothetical protein AMECASPLE_012013, partial [Ameca splendens]
SPPSASGSKLYQTESAHPDSPTCSYSVSDLSASEAVLSSDEPVQKSKNQRLSTREFSCRSIKERAVLMSTMFHGSNKPPAPLPVSQVESSTSSSPSSPSPPPLSLSKSSTMFPVVHPVPDPTAQSCFSAILPNTSEPKEPPSPLSCSQSEKTEQNSSSHPDSFTSNKKTGSPMSSLCIDQSQNVFTNLKRINKRSWNNNVENEQQRIHETALKLAEKDPTECAAICDGERTRRIAPKSIIRSESCPSGAPSYSKEVQVQTRFSSSTMHQYFLGINSLFFSTSFCFFSTLYKY